MRIECTQENLSRALLKISRLVGTRGTLPVLGNILLSAEKGRLRLAATDLEVGIQTWIGGKVEEEGSLTVPARLFVDFVSTNTDPTISLSTNQTTLHLQSKKFTANIKGIDAQEFPLIPEIERTNKLSIPIKTFKEAITQTVFATAIDETRPILTGVLFTIKQSTLTLVATDSYRLAERIITLSGEYPDLTVIVPARTLQELSRILSDQSEKEIEIYLSENQILFVFDDTSFISRLIDGVFPDYHQILPKESTTKVVFQKNQAAQVMKMASFFARETANNIHLQVQDGQTDQVTVTAISPQLGDNQSVLSAQVEGPAVEIAFNAKFILDALAIFPTEKIHLELTSSLQPGILRPDNTDQYLYLLMPLRIDG